MAVNKLKKLKRPFFVALLVFLVASILMILADNLRKVDSIPDKRIQAKLSLLQPQKDSINIFFVGSSLVGLNINGRLFDSLTKSRSFNFGTGGMLLDAKVDFIKLLVKDGYINAGNTVIMEAGLQPLFNPKAIEKRKYRYPEYAQYLKSTRSTINDFKYAFYRHFPRADFKTLFGYYLDKYVSSRNKTSFTAKREKIAIEDAISILSQNGKVEVCSKTGTLTYASHHKETIKNKDLNKLKTRVRNAFALNDSIIASNRGNPEIIDYYKELETFCAESHIKLVVLIPFLGPSFPVPGGVAWEPVPMLQLESFVINPDFVSHPSFNIEEMVYDLRHFNKQGQVAYTKVLAEAYLHWLEEEE